MTVQVKELYYRYKQIPWPQKLLTVSVLLLFAALVFQTLTPQQVPEQTEVFTSVADLKNEPENITFTGQPPRVPDRLNTAEVAAYDRIDNHAETTLVDYFNLAADPNFEGIWRNNVYALTTTRSPDLLILSRSRVEGEEVQEDVNSEVTQGSIDIAISNANEIVSLLYPENPPQLLSDSIYYLNDDHEPEIVDNIIEANSITLSYAFQINGIPVYPNHEAAEPVYFIYSATGELIKLQVNPYTVTTSQKRNYETYSVNQAVNNINAGHSALFFADYLGSDNEGLVNISSGEMTKARLEYRFSVDTGTIMPYYHFYGDVENEDGLVIRTELITPAIRTNFSE